MARWAFQVGAGVLAQPAGPVMSRLADLEDWALAQPPDQHVARGVLAALGWLSGVYPTGPLSGRPRPTEVRHVVAELGRALAALRGPCGSTYARAAGVVLVLATAAGDDVVAQQIVGDVFRRVLRDWDTPRSVAVITGRPAA